MVSIGTGSKVGFSSSSGVKPPPWHDELWDYAVKHGVGVEAGVDIAQEVLDRLGGFIREELDRDIPLGGLEDDFGALLGLGADGQQDG